MRTRIRIHVSAFLVLLVPAFGILTPMQTLLLWCCAALHEIGHAGAYALCKAPLKTVTVWPFGLHATLTDTLRISPKNEMLCALAGPAVNLALMLILLVLPLPPQNADVRYALYCNLSLFVINLLPVLPLDGGRAVYYAAACKHDAAFCERISLACARAVCAFLAVPAIAAMAQDRNPSLLLIWGYLVFYTWTQRGSI